MSRSYHISEIAEITSSVLHGNTDSGISVEKWAIDSRFRGIDEKTCFIALKTERNDGHKYIAPVYDMGVRCFMIDGEVDYSSFPEAVFLKAENALNALQKIAGHRRGEIAYPVLAITGSNGKTVIKEWLFQVLGTQMSVYKSPKSYNSQIGVALSLLMLPEKSELAIIEAGISQPGEMKKLREMISPDLGLISNIHTAHLENFKGKNELAKEKLQLFENVDALFIRDDYEEIHNEIKENPSFTNKEIISWSNQEERSTSFYITFQDNGSVQVIRVKSDDIEYDFTIPFEDPASAENAVFVILLSMRFDLNLDLIDDMLKNLPPVAMRLEQLQGLNNCTIINDSYNSDLTSLEVALNFMSIQHQNQGKKIILSDIYQSGLSNRDLYTKVSDLLRQYGIEKVIGVGPNIQEYASCFSQEIETYISTDDLLGNLDFSKFQNDTILIKGARAFEFERISNFLEFKKHETRLEVNLSAAIENLNFYRSKLKEGVKTMAMVKAFSYGTSSFEIANVLAHHQVDYLAVAYIDEGVNLRKRGISLPIMVMNPAMGEIQKMLDFELEAEVYNLNDLKMMHEYLKTFDQRLKIHLKVETGMHRLGIEIEELPAIVEYLREDGGIDLASVFTHLVGSDNKEMDEFTNAQFSRFDQFCEELNGSGITSFFKHVLNSDGILRFEDRQYDMVRLGIGLYGFTSVKEFKNQLKSVVSLRSRISQIKDLKAGDSVGYSRSFTAEKEMKIATVPVGYADGLVRKLGNGNWQFSFANEKTPIVGNICMDMTMVDITDIEGVREKDEIVIFADNDDVYEMARIRETIPYEILTSLSERIKRIFYYGD